MGFTDRYKQIISSITSTQISGVDFPSDFVVPGLIREVYQLAFKAKVNSCNDRLVPPKEMESCGEFVVFAVENHSVVTWGYRKQDEG